VRNVRVTDNVFEGSMYGFRVKTARGRGGEVTGVVFRNNRMRDVEIPLVFTSYYEYRPMDLREAEKQRAGDGGFVLGNQIWPGESEPARAFVPDGTPDIHDILIDGLVATGADRAGIAVGLPERPIARLVLRNVRVTARSGFVVRHAEVRGDRSAFRASAGESLTLQRGGTFTKPN
jgi:polygalacturonase